MSNINYISHIGWYILIIATIFELILFPSLENLCGCTVCLYGWLLFSQFVFNNQNFRTLFLPTVAVSGYLVMYFFLPLVMTLVEFKPITYNFEVPFITFFNQTLNATIIILAFLVCKSIYKPNNFLNRLWNNIGFFKSPSDIQIWIMSISSLVLFAVSQLTLHTIDNSDYSFDDMQKSAEGGGIMSIFASLSIYFGMPICFFFRKWYGSKEKMNYKIALVIYFIILLMIALISTRRSVLFKPIFSAAIFYALYLVLENKKIFTTARFFLYSMLFLLLTGPVADLAMAMALRRGDVKTISDVVSMLSNRDELHKQFNIMRDFAGDSDNSYSWSENYVNNIFLDRFCNLRVQDATIFYAHNLGYDNQKMHEYVKDKILYKIPTPIVHALGEKKINRTTPTDLMLDEYFHIKGYTRIGNMVTGDTGAGLYWLGYLYYPVAFIIYVFAFYFLGSLTTLRFGTLIIPIPILCTMQSYFMYFGNAYGIISSIEMLIRDGWMEILVYCAFFFIIRLFKNEYSI